MSSSFIPTLFFGSMGLASHSLEVHPTFLQTWAWHCPPPVLHPDSAFPWASEPLLPALQRGSARRPPIFFPGWSSPGGSTRVGAPQRSQSTGRLQPLGPHGDQRGVERWSDGACGMTECAGARPAAGATWGTLPAPTENTAPAGGPMWLWIRRLLGRGLELGPHNQPVRQ